LPEFRHGKRAIKKGGKTQKIELVIQAGGDLHINQTIYDEERTKSVGRERQERGERDLFCRQERIRRRFAAQPVMVKAICAYEQPLPMQPRARISRFSVASFLARASAGTGLAKTEAAAKTKRAVKMRVNCIVVVVVVVGLFGK